MTDPRTLITVCGAYRVPVDEEELRASVGRHTVIGTEQQVHAFGQEVRRRASGRRLVHASAEGADLRSSFIGAIQRLLRDETCFGGSVFVFYAVPAAGLAQVFAQQLASLWIEEADLPRIPLHLHSSSNPSGRRTVTKLRHPNIGGQSTIRTSEIPKGYRVYSTALSASQPTART